MTNPHLTQPLLVKGKPLASAQAAVIAVHGRDRDPEDIIAVCTRIGCSDLAWLAPAAANASWYPLGFMDALADNEPWLSYALERVDSLVRELLAKGFDRHNIVLLGFSQGACIAAEYALRHPHRYGGLLIFTGAAMGPAGTSWNREGDFGGTPALVSGGVKDDWVPAARMRETAQLLKAKGAEVTEYFYAGNEHVINDEEIRIARRVIESLKKCWSGNKDNAASHVA